MAKRSSSRISKRKTSPDRHAVHSTLSGPLPAVDPPALISSPWRRAARVFVRGVVPVVFALFIAYMVVWHRHSDADESLQEAVAMLANRKICEQYKELKNHGDASANQLLATLPEVPADPISQEQADRFHADCFLHQNIRIVSIRMSSSNRLILSTHGNVSAPAISVRGAHGVERIQRTMSNPDLCVEVRDGKLHGVRAELHSGD